MDEMLMDLALRMGWKTAHGRWWKPDSHGAANTREWAAVRAYLFPGLELHQKPPK